MFVCLHFVLIFMVSTAFGATFSAVTFNLYTPSFLINALYTLNIYVYICQILFYVPINSLNDNKKIMGLKKIEEHSTHHHDDHDEHHDEEHHDDHHEEH